MVFGERIGGIRVWFWVNVHQYRIDSKKVWSLALDPILPIEWSFLAVMLTAWLRKNQISHPHHLLPQTLTKRMRWYPSYGNSCAIMKIGYKQAALIPLSRVGHWLRHNPYPATPLQFRAWGFPSHGFHINVHLLTFAVFIFVGCRYTRPALCNLSHASCARYRLRRWLRLLDHR